MEVWSAYILTSLLPGEREPLVDRRLGGCHSLSGHGEGEKNTMPVPGVKTWLFLSCLAYPVAVLAEVYWLHGGGSCPEVVAPTHLSDCMAITGMPQSRQFRLDYLL
jgi:hypothetical protein